MNASRIFTDDVEKEIQAEKIYLEFLSSKLPKILKDDEEFMFAMNKLIKDSERHEAAFREAAKKAIEESK